MIVVCMVMGHVDERAGKKSALQTLTSILIKYSFRAERCCACSCLRYCAFFYLLSDKNVGCCGILVDG